MLYLFTFCVQIGKHSNNELLRVLDILISSLNKTNTYELHIFTNIEINVNNSNNSNNSNIVLHKYFDNNVNIYSDNWLNLSFNKINIYKYLYDKFAIDFTWIDLDTIVTTNLDYINNLSSYFIDCGGINEDPHLLIDNAYIPRNKWIQGSMWKLNIKLYEKFIQLYNDFSIKNMKFEYDLQGIFTYYMYFVLGGNTKILLDNDIYIIGRNIKTEVVNGLCIWHPNGNTHANLNGLNNLYYDNDVLKSKFYPDKELHIISFTFDTLKQLYNTDKFKELFVTKI